MTDFEKLVSKLELQIKMDINNDPKILELHRQILEQIKIKTLPNESTGKKYLNNLDKEEQIRSEFIRMAANFGGDIASQNIEAESLYPECRIFNSFIRYGLALIGQEIGSRYARELYPELCKLRDAGQKLPFQEPEQAPQVHSFTLTRYEDRYVLGNVTKLEEPWDNSIAYDKKQKCFTEEFVFNSLSKAEAAHGAWQRFITNQTKRPPVAYCLTVRHNKDKSVTILSFAHVTLSSKNSNVTQNDGCTVEKMVFNNPFEAEEAKKSLEQIKPENPKPERPQKSHRRRHRKHKKTEIPAPQVQERQQTHENNAQTKSKGRSV